MPHWRAGVTSVGKGTKVLISCHGHAERVVVMVMVCFLGGLVFVCFFGNKRYERKVFFERDFRKTVFEKKNLKEEFERWNGRRFLGWHVPFAWLTRLV